MKMVGVAANTDLVFKFWYFVHPGFFFFCIDFDI